MRASWASSWFHFPPLPRKATGSKLSKELGSKKPLAQPAPPRPADKVARASIVSLLFVIVLHTHTDIYTPSRVCVDVPGIDKSLAGTDFDIQLGWQAVQVALEAFGPRSQLYGGY